MKNGVKMIIKIVCGEFQAAHMFIYMFLLYAHSFRYLVVRCAVLCLL